MFFLSRFLFELLVPLNLGILLALLALCAHSLGKRVAGNVFLTIALIILFFFGYGIGIKDKVANREHIYPPLTKARLLETDLSDVQYIVVLGSGHVSDSRLPVNSRIGGSSLYRLIEGVRLLRMLPETKLLLSGGPVYDQIANADVVKEVALRIGILPERIITENRPMDTMEEARLLEPLLRKNRFVLVTSAMHMPRAMEIFTVRGMRPVAAPTDYIIKEGNGRTVQGVLPTTGNLDLSRRLMYEWAGTQWYKFRCFVGSLQKRLG